MLVSLFKAMEVHIKSINSGSLACKSDYTIIIENIVSHKINQKKNWVVTEYIL